MHRIAGRLDHCHGDPVAGVYSRALRQCVGQKRRNSKRRVCNLYLWPALRGERGDREATLAMGFWLYGSHSRDACQYFICVDRPDGFSRRSGMSALFAIKRRKTRGAVLAFGGAILIGVVGWTSSGERLVFWKKSLEFISKAPLIGHGTGTIRSLYEKSAVGKTGAAGKISTNPHNQTFAIGIQLGFAGVVGLWAMCSLM